jgi:integrase
VEYLTKQEVTRLLEVAYEANRDHHLAILLGYATGARVSQILDLTGTSVDVASKRVRIAAQKRGFARFHNLHVDSNPVFDLSPIFLLAEQRGVSKLFGGLSRQYLDERIKAYGKKAGIHSDLLHFHCLRHSIAMIIWDKTQRPGAITQFLGHRDPSSAWQYLQENDGRMADDAVEQHAF